MKRLIRRVLLIGRVFIEQIPFTMQGLWSIPILILALWPLKTLATGTSTCATPWTSYHGFHAGGLTQQITANSYTEDSCKQACIDRPDCLSVDYYTLARTCWHGTEANPSRSDNRPNVNHFDLNRSCLQGTQQSTTASQPSTTITPNRMFSFNRHAGCTYNWTTYSGMHIAGQPGALVQQGAFGATYTRDACLQACIASPTCLSVDYNNQHKDCWHGTSANLSRTVSPRIDHFVLTRNCEWTQEIDQPSSPVTRDLKRLAEIQINADNVQSIAGQLANLTKKFEQLNYFDLMYASRIIESIAGLSNLTTKVGELLMAAINDISFANNNALLKAEETYNATSRIVSAMDKFAGNVKLDSSGQLSLNGSNVDLLVADRTSVKQVLGAGLTKSSSHLSLYDQPIDLDVRNSAEAVIILPEWKIVNTQRVQSSDQNSADTPTRIYFTLHRKPGLLQVLERGELNRDDFVFHSLASVIISATINGTPVSDLESPIIITFKTQNVLNGLEKKCAYWDYDEGTSKWFWSVKNLSSNSIEKEQDGRITCYSTHLTNFAVIAGYTETDPVLNTISIIGLVLSIIGLSLTVFSHFAFRLWQDKRRSRTQLVLLNLSISLLAVDLIVIGGLKRTADSSAGCKSVAALLQYFLLVSFSWMLIEGVLQYLKFVKVFDIHSSHFMYKTTIPAWICPGLIIALVAAIDPEQFRGHVQYCWLAPLAFYYAFLLPLALIMITNLVLFILVIKSVTCDRLDVRSTQKKDELAKFQVLLGICSFIVMGLAWLSAFIAVVAKVAVMYYLFCILNSTQGFLIFLFLNVREKQVRDGWKNLLSKCCPCIEITTVTSRVDMREIKPLTGKQRRTTLNTKRITFHASRNALKANENSSGKTGESSSMEVTNSNNTTDTSVSINSGPTYVRRNFGLSQP